MLQQWWQKLQQQHKRGYMQVSTDRLCLLWQLCSVAAALKEKGWGGSNTVKLLPLSPCVSLPPPPCARSSGFLIQHSCPCFVDWTNSSQTKRLLWPPPSFSVEPGSDIVMLHGVTALGSGGPGNTAGNFLCTSHENNVFAAASQKEVGSPESLYTMTNWTGTVEGTAIRSHFK